MASSAPSPISSSVGHDSGVQLSRQPTKPAMHAFAIPFYGF